MLAVTLERLRVSYPGLEAPTLDIMTLTGHGAEVAELLLSLARESGATLIAVSHDERLIKRLDRRLGLQAGRLADADFAGLAA